MLTVMDIEDNKKRYAKLGTASFMQLRAAVIDSEEGILTTMEKPFMALEDDKVYKFLKIANESFSKKIDDQMLSLTIRKDAYSKMVLKGLVESELKDEEILNVLYQEIEKKYGFLGKILVTVMYEAWDVPKRAKDGKKLEDSEYISRRVLCTICPINLTKPGLEYHQAEGLRARNRDWVVDKPEAAFLWPAWEGGEDNPNKILYYTKDPSDTQHDFMESSLETLPIETATEVRKAFDKLIEKNIFDEDKLLTTKEAIKKEIWNKYLDIQKITGGDTEGLLFEDDLQVILEDAGIQNTELISRIVADYNKRFLAKPKIKWLLTDKDIIAAELRKKKEEYNKLMNKAAKEIKTLGGNTELADQLNEAAHRNR